jgi:type II secretory pathway component GspD/PulD (secretin)
MSLTTTRTPIICLLIALLLTASIGPVSRAHADEQGQEVVTLRVAAETSMEDFLKAARTALGYTIVWDANDKQIRNAGIQSDLSFRGTADEVFTRLRALLTFYELVMIRVGPKTAQMYLVMDARRTSSILKLNAEFIEVTADNVASLDDLHGYFITTNIRVQHMTDLRNARTALSRIVTGQNIGSVTEVPDAKAFVVTDFAPNVAAIWRVLQAMDVPSARTERVIEAFTLEHAPANNAADQLRALFPPTASPRVNTGRGTPVVLPEDDRAHFAADERAKQVIASATPAQIVQIRAALKLIDRSTPKVETTIELVRVENVDANIAAETLSRVALRTSSLWGEPGNPNTQPSVVPVHGSNSVIFSGSADAITILRHLLQEMDEAAGEAGEDEK